MNDIINDNESYTTSDVVLAAAIALYYPLEAVDRNDAIHPQFVFQLDANLEELVKQYKGGELLVEPRAYVGRLWYLEEQMPSDIE